MVCTFQSQLIIFQERKPSTSPQSTPASQTSPQSTRLPPDQPTEHPSSPQTSPEHPCVPDQGHVPSTHHLQELVPTEKSIRTATVHQTPASSGFYALAPAAAWLVAHSRSLPCILWSASFLSLSVFCMTLGILQSNGAPNVSSSDIFLAELCRMKKKSKP